MTSWFQVVSSAITSSEPPARCSCSVFPTCWENFEELSVAISNICSKEVMFYFKLALSCCYDWLSFISNRKLTALLCFVCFLLFHTGVAERSFLGEERQHISRLALCLVRIPLKLDAFASPHSLVLNPVGIAPHTSQVSCLKSHD